MKKHFSLIIVSLLLCLSNSKLHAAVWANIRDGALYIKNGSPLTVISLTWKNVWNSDSQTDHIYLQNPDGTLKEKIILAKDNTPGNIDVRLDRIGVYKLELAGACYRSLTVSLPDKIKSMFAPVKVHKSISLPKSKSLFFHVPENHSFSFNAKNYGGVKEFWLSLENAEESYQLECNKYLRYSQFDSRDFDISGNSRFWKVEWQGQGKISFWLDGVPNLFVKQPDDYFALDYSPRDTEVTITEKIEGHTPSIGVAFPFEYLPEHSYQIMKNWGVAASNHYVFLDYLQRKGDQGVDFKQLYEQKFNINQNNAIFGLSNRKYVYRATEENKNSIFDFLKKSSSQNSTTYYSIGDEPNLNYPSFESYSRTFGDIASSIKNHVDPAVRQSLIAIPQSSRFLNGPTIEGSEKRRGFDWAQKLIEQYGRYIDAISWHEWLVRDLIDTGRYHEAVSQADGLIEKYKSNFTKRPALIIGQTNISSGSTISPYENETYFASLWWVSVVINSSKAGKLDQLIWFKAVDDGVYQKGILSRKGSSIVEKPVSEAMSFINSHLGKWVLNVDYKTPELDLLGTLSDHKQQMHLLGVNKSKHPHKLTVQLPRDYRKGVLYALSESGMSQRSLQVSNKIMDVEIDQETIFAISYEK